MRQFSDYVIYVDESDDHGLTNYSADYPVFVLSFCIFRKEVYVQQIVPAGQRIKFKHFGHDMVVFHERDIVKASGPFEMLNDPGKKTEFLNDINEWVRESPFTIICVVIRKPQLVAKHTNPPNPYHFAMRLGLERVDRYLKKNGQVGRTTHIVFESRGGKEDAELRTEFGVVCRGANYAGEAFDFEIEVVPKRVNSCGLQMADLTARPIGRHAIAPDQPNRAYAIIEPKLDRGSNGRVMGCGLKCYP